jgi:hypothetical protein
MRMIFYPGETDRGNKEICEMTVLTEKSLVRVCHSGLSGICCE